MVRWQNLPDPAYVAGTTFSCALIKDNWKLHLIPSLQFQIIMYFFYMEEQLLAVAHLICDEAKLEKSNIYMKICWEKIQVISEHL